MNVFLENVLILIKQNATMCVTWQQIKIFINTKIQNKQTKQKKRKTK